jgi:hypothetical protein
MQPTGPPPYQGAGAPNSYGDRYWAHATKHPFALYSHTTEPTRDAIGRGYASRAAPVQEDR